MAGPVPTQSAAVLLAQLGARASARFGERVAEVGLTATQTAMLGLLTGRPNTSQQELARSLGMVPSRVVALIDELEESGLVRRVRDGGDRRRNTLVLTAAGEGVLQRVAAIAREHEDALCAALSADERDSLIELLGRIAAEQELPGIGYPGAQAVNARP